MIDVQVIREAAHRIAPFIHQTPIFSSSYLNQVFEAEIYFKAENFQKTGSFKARGATNSVLQLSTSQRQKGVATHSSGNHGQALAWAAKAQGVRAIVVMPENAPGVKIEAVKQYGAEVVFCASNLPAREQALVEVIERTGATFIPPFNFENTITGQATCALEIFNQAPAPDFLLAPVGGGGLLAGSALSAHFFSPQTVVLGCEPAQANDAWQSFRKGVIVPAKPPNTIADGLRTSLGEIPFPYIREHVADILTCSEENILRAMRITWERMKLVIEPSASVPLACMLENRPRFKGRKVAVIISGGNVDLDEIAF